MNTKIDRSGREFASAEPVGGGYLPDMSFSGMCNDTSISLKALRRGIGLVASPAFMAMAVICSVWPNELAAICGGGENALPLTGMVWMYFLMAVFHLGAWIRLIEYRDDVQIEPGAMRSEAQ